MSATHCSCIDGGPGNTVLGSRARFLASWVSHASYIWKAPILDHSERSVSKSAMLRHLVQSAKRFWEPIHASNIRPVKPPEQLQEVCARFGGIIRYQTISVSAAAWRKFITLGYQTFSLPTNGSASGHGLSLILVPDVIHGIDRNWARRTRAA